MMPHKFFAILLLLVGSAAVAQDASLFGVALGTPLESFHSCGPPPSSSSTICMQDEPMGDRRAIELHPDHPLGLKSHLLARFSDARIASVAVITTGADYQDALLTRLIARYGKPSELQRTPLQNVFGMQIDGIDATWLLRSTSKGPIIASVVFKGIDGSIESGYILLSR